MTFTMGATSTHAIQFGTSAPTTMTLRGITFSGYNTTTGDAGTANDAVLYFPDKGTDTTWTINAVGCNGTISYKKARSGDTVNIVADPVTVAVTVKDADTGALLTDARVLVWVTSTAAGFPYQAPVTISGSGTTATVTHTAHGMSSNDSIIVEDVNEQEYNGAYDITVTGPNTYTYNTGETVTTGTPTGSPIVTFAFISEATTGTGVVTDSRVVSTNQPIAYRVRKATTSPRYKQAAGTDTVSSTTGLSFTANLVLDE